MAGADDRPMPVASEAAAGDVAAASVPSSAAPAGSAAAAPAAASAPPPASIELARPAPAAAAAAGPSPSPSPSSAVLASLSSPPAAARASTSGGGGPSPARTPSGLPPGRMASKLMSVSEEAELGRLESGSAATSRSASGTLRRAGSGGGGGAPKPRPQLALRHRARAAWSAATHFWWGLPTACKATMVVAVINFIISVVYAVVGLMLSGVDEEIHISIVIIVSAVFVVYAVVDAIIYENTLELVTSVLLDTLVVARVLWFASRGNANSTFKWVWAAIMLSFQAVYIVCAVLTWRQFGWRLYGKVGVDFREKGAAGRMRQALQRNAYVTLLKLNVMLLVAMSAVAIDVSFEKRGGDVLEGLLVISFVGLFVCALYTWLAAKVALATDGRLVAIKWLLAFHASMLVALVQPIATLIIYNSDTASQANANISINVGGGIYCGTLLLVWLSTHLMWRRRARSIRQQASAPLSGPLTSGSMALGHPVLAPMLAGAWLGKPTPGNPRKIRFFQLSSDGSTLRWGWNKFVRLYYVDDLASSEREHTITLTFPFDSELTLKFPDKATYAAWRRGLAHLLLCLMAPDAPEPPPDAAEERRHAVGHALPGEGAWGVVGRTSSRFLRGSQMQDGLSLAAELAEEEGAAPDTPGAPQTRQPRSPSQTASLLRLLGVRVQELGRRAAPRRRGSPGASASPAERLPRSGSDLSDPSTAAGTSTAPTTPYTSSTRPGQGAEPAAGSAEGQVAQLRQVQAAEADAAQQAKRRKMAEYLQTIARASQPGWRPALPAGEAADGTPEHKRPRRAAAAGGQAPMLVDAGVQTDESELLSTAAAYSSVRVPAAPSTPTHMMQIRDASGDAGVAASYMAAMAAAAAGGAAASASGAPAASKGQQQEEQEQQQQGEGTGDDADVAAHYMAAMAAAMGGAAHQQQQVQQVQQQQGEQVPASNGDDSDIAAQYAAAMAAAWGGGGSGGGSGFSGGTPLTSAPASQQQQAQPGYGRSSGPASASPLEQLAAQQQRRSLNQQLVASVGSPSSPADRTPVTRSFQSSLIRTQGVSMGSGGLWQLAAAVDVIDYEELSFGKLLGTGAEGAVYAAWFLESPVAVKKFNRVEDSLHEVEMYLLLGSHDNVVALRGLCQHEGCMYLVLEYCPRGTLDVLLHHTAKGRWDPQKLLPMIRSIARGMHYLHSRSILHRDLKPANIFVGHGQLMKIGDFGMARLVAPEDDGSGGPPVLRRLTPGVVGTLQYTAPELINEDLRPQGMPDCEWALKLDIWSFGVCLWEVLERRRPFEGLSQNAVQAQWVSDPYEARLPPVRLPDQLDRAGKRVYRGLSDLVEDCTRLDPHARPSSRDILLRLKSLAAFSTSDREMQ